MASHRNDDWQLDYPGCNRFTLDNSAKPQYFLLMYRWLFMDPTQPEALTTAVYTAIAKRAGAQSYSYILEKLQPDKMRLHTLGNGLKITWVGNSAPSRNYRKTRIEYLF